MRYLLIFVILLPMCTKASCPNYTNEQEHLITFAYAQGDLYDLGYTTASIMIQESFIGDRIIRINPKDGKAGSYGLMHTTLEWIMSYEGESSYWRAKEIYPTKLLTDDYYGITMGINHLIKDQHRGWREMVKRYNGSGVYADKVAKHLKMLKNCYQLEEV